MNERKKIATSIKAKLMGVLVGISLLLLITGTLSLVSMNRVIRSTQIITQQEVPRMMLAQEASFTMIRSIDAMNKIFDIEEFSGMEDVKNYEAIIKSNLLRFDMLLAALTWGTQTEAFEKASGGIIKAQWMQSELNEVFVIEKPNPNQAQLAGAVSIYSFAFAQHTEMSIKDYRTYLNTLPSDNPELIATARANAMMHKKHFRGFFTTTVEALDDFIRASNQTTKQSIEEIELLQKYMLLVILLMSVFGFMMALIFSVDFTNKVLQTPLSKLMSTVEKISKGDLSKRAQVLSKDELGQLGQAFNQMTAKLEKSYLYLEEKVQERTKELASEKKKLETTLASIGDGAFTIDRKGEITFFNKMAEKLTGFKKKEVLGKPYQNILKFIKENNKKEDYKSIEMALKKGKIGYMANHHFLASKNGKKIPIANSAAPIQDDRGKVSGCIVIFRDMTHEHEVDQMKTEFIALASHQLRTPLTAIRWFSELLLDEEFGPLNNKQKEFIADTQGSIVRMTELVNGLINISKISAGKLDVTLESVDVNDFVKAFFQEIKPLAQKKKQKLIFEKTKEVSKVKTDPKLLREILMNLLSNSIKYSPEKKSIKLKVSVEKKKLLFEVIDHGCGIPKEQQKYIFNKFFRADNASQKENKGSGLGLYLVQKLLEVLGGKIWFESNKKVTTFSFTLPLKK